MKIANKIIRKICSHCNQESYFHQTSKLRLNKSTGDFNPRYKCLRCGSKDG